MEQSTFKIALTSMDLISNELSFYPLAENEHIAEQRFYQLLKTFSAAQEKYGFSHIRFHSSFHQQFVTTTQTFYEWVSTLTNHKLKNLIVGLFRHPFSDDLEVSELASFFKSEYKIPQAEVLTKQAPVGLSVSYIKSLPAISFDSHLFWRNRVIEVQRSNSTENGDAKFDVYNICLETDIFEPELDDWANSCMSNLIETEVILKKFLNYTKYNTVFSFDFMDQFLDWKQNDTDTFKYILLLMKDVQLHPFSGGMGQTENLKKRGKEASKRINIVDRLSYTLDKDVVTFLACKGHYEFH